MGLNYTSWLGRYEVITCKLMKPFWPVGRFAATRPRVAPGGGFGFGSGNTIANYIPLENYLAMLDKAKRVGWDGC